MADIVTKLGMEISDLELPAGTRPKAIGDVLQSDGERHFVYQQAFKLSWADGVFTPAEWKALEQLREALGLSAAVAANLEARVLSLVRPNAPG